MCTLQHDYVPYCAPCSAAHVYLSLQILCKHAYIYYAFLCAYLCTSMYIQVHQCEFSHAFTGVYVCIQRGEGKVKLHSGASRQDTRSKYTHFLISHIGQPAAPQETNNGLVITPRQHTKELLTGNSSDFTTVKHAHLPIQFISDCTKGLPKEWRWVQISPYLLTPLPHVACLLAKLDMRHCMITRCSAIVVNLQNVSRQFLAEPQVSKYTHSVWYDQPQISYIYILYINQILGHIFYY